MALNPQKKKVLSVANLHALISPNPRSFGIKHPDDSNIKSQNNFSSPFDSQSYSLSYSQNSQSSGPNIDEKFSFPKLNPDSDDNSPFSRSSLSAYKSPSSTELLHLSELQQNRKTLQDHEESISKLVSSMNNSKDDIKTLCGDFKSFKSDLKNKNNQNEEYTEYLLSMVKQEINDNGKRVVNTLRDDVIAKQMQLMERTCEKVESLQTNVDELFVLYKNGISNMETLLKKKLLELSADQAKRFDELEHTMLQLQERKFNELRKDLDVIRGRAVTPAAKPAPEEDFLESGNSFDDVFNVDHVSQIDLNATDTNKNFKKKRKIGT